MGLATTIYDVRLRYGLEDRAGKGVDILGKKAELAAKRFHGASLGIGAIASAATGLLSFSAAKSVLVDYNSQLEQARIQAAGLLQGAQGGSFSFQIGQANSVIAELEKRAKTSTATTAEFVGFMKEVVGPLANAGMKTKDLAEFTHKAVVAAKAFGDEGVAAFDVQQALTSQVTIRDRFANKLLRLVHKTRDEFNKMGTAERLQTLQLALKHEAIGNMAKAQENSFAGVFSTLQDSLQILGGKGGMPFFRFITAEIKSWNKWLDANEAKLRVWGQNLANSLIEAFQTIKKVVGFLVENREWILAMAKAFIASKATQPFQAVLGGLLNLQNGAFTLAGSLGALNIAVGALVATISLAESAQEERIDQKVRFSSIDRELRFAGRGKVGHARGVLKELQEEKLVSGAPGSRKIDKARVSAFAKDAYMANLESVNDYDDYDLARKQVQVLEQIKAAIEVESKAQMQIARQNVFTLVKQFEGGLWRALAIAQVEQVNTILRRHGLLKDDSAPSNVNVTINRIEAKTEDPDRFIFQLETAFRDAARHPSTAFDPLRRG